MKTVSPSISISIQSAIQTGAFELLTVQPHQRVVPVWGDPAATDAAPTNTVTEVPYRPWGGFIIEAQTGRAYFHGGGHGDYQDMAVDTCDLTGITNNVMVWVQNIGPPFTGYRRTRVPPPGDPIYGSAGSPYLWADADPTIWQPASPHMYARNTSHPTLGFLHDHQVPTNLSAPVNSSDSIGGIASWSPVTGKRFAHASLSNPATEWYPEQSDFSDWNSTLNKLVIFSGATSRDRVYVLEWSPGGPVTQVKQVYPTEADPAQFCRFSHWLENDKYLVCTDGLFKPPNLFAWLHNSTTLTKITSPSYLALFNNNSQNVMACADRDHRKIWFLKGMDAEPPELYCSTFDDPANIVLYPITDNPAFRVPSCVQGPGGHKGMQYFGGYLYVPIASGRSMGPGSRGVAADFWRLAVA